MKDMISLMEQLKTLT